MTKEPLVKLHKEGSFALLLAALFLGAAACGADDKYIEAQVRKGVENWSKISGVVVTEQAQASLIDDVTKAGSDLLKKGSVVTRRQIDEVTPAAVATFLERSQDNQPSAPLAAILRQAATGNAVVLPELTDYPTLVIEVRPPEPADFVVTIDQVAFVAGRTRFRVSEGMKTVRVTRGNKAPCQEIIQITRTGPNTVVCAL